MTPTSTAPAPSAARSQPVPWPDLAIGLVVGFLGLWQAGADYASWPGLLVVLGMAVAAGTYRLVPSLALALVWAASSLQVLSRLEITLAQLATILVAYGTARHGRAATVWLSGLSAPVGAVIALIYVQTEGAPSLVGLGRAIVPPSVTSLTSAFLLVLVLLSAPWALGLVLRLRAQFQQARAQREQAEIEAVRAQEIGELRAEQARLARDVHDVVGHSLTVILAQADSVEFMEDGDIERIRAAVGNISASARRSLGDVRQVLSSTSDAPDGTTRMDGGLDSLLEGVSGAGNDVRSQVEGTPRPLPPELDVVAFRVLQEMLTNALKHGRRGAPIEVVRTWLADDLQIVVRNAVADETQAAPGGIGQVGMQRRLEAVGGRLDLRTDEAPGVGRVFTAAAWVPLRPRGQAGRTGA